LEDERRRVEQESNNESGAPKSRRVRQFRREKVLFLGRRRVLGFLHPDVFSLFKIKAGSYPIAQRQNENFNICETGLVSRI
jgi:hypothetical protein